MSRFKLKLSLLCALAGLAVSPAATFAASLGLVKIGSAEQHRQTLAVDEMQNDLPKLAARDRIDAH